MNDSQPAQENVTLLDEQLVAYLDGELALEEVEEVERRLARDPATREHLKSLGRTWEALDELPRSPTTVSFTSSTLEMVSVAASDVIAAQRLTVPGRRLRFWATLCVVGVAGVVFGFATARHWRPDPDEPIVRDLPVIQHLDSYQHVGNIEFLRMLNDQNLFHREPDDAT